MGNFCDSSNSSSSVLEPVVADQEEKNWQCAVFVTFVITYSLLLILAICLYAYYRWQENMKLKLYQEDYENFRYNSEGQGHARKSSQNGSRGGQSLLIPPNTPKTVILESQGSDKINKS
jgi:hypothetical protein